jgi:hypothetical protein
MLGLALSAVALLTGAQASAALLVLGGGKFFTTPGSNDVIDSPGVPMLDNATIATTAANVRLTFYFLGSESGFTNTLNVGSNTHTEGANSDLWPGTGTLLFSTVVATAGAVPMFFTSSDWGSDTLAPGGAALGRSIAFAYLDCITGNGCVQTSTATNRVLFALDDSGAGPDDNHDDYVGYMVASPVPLPAAFWLLGSGLLGLLGIARRRSA